MGSPGTPPDREAVRNGDRPLNGPGVAVGPDPAVAWDVTIVGAGVAGCATAIALKTLWPELRVAVLDAAENRRQIGESIPPDTRPLLQRLGILAEFLDAGHEPCLGSAAAWGSAELGYNDFLLNPHGPGWHLDRERFDRMLRRRARECGAVIAAGWRLRNCRYTADGFTIALSRLAGPTHLVATRFVVDATGGAFVGRRLGAQLRHHDRLVLATAFFHRPAGPPSRLTLLEAVETGWWYAADLPGNLVAVAYASDPTQFRQAGTAHWPSWAADLARTRHIARRLSVTQPLSRTLLSRAAPSCRLDRAAGPGWLAVGDAAASYDPLSAQGIHKALANGLDAAAEICVGLRSGHSHPDRASYAAAAWASFQEYRTNHRYLYELERRFERAPFWSRRHRSGVLGGPFTASDLHRVVDGHDGDGVRGAGQP